jgi:hypothetical protein
VAKSIDHEQKQRALQEYIRRIDSGSSSEQVSPLPVRSNSPTEDDFVRTWEDTYFHQPSDLFFRLSVVAEYVRDRPALVTALVETAQNPELLEYFFLSWQAHLEDKTSQQHEKDFSSVIVSESALLRAFLESLLRTEEIEEQKTPFTGLEEYFIYDGQFVKAWIDNGVHVVQSSDNRLPEAIKQWEAVTIRSIENWPPGQLYRTLHTFPYNRLAHTPTNQAATNRISEVGKERFGESNAGARLAMVAQAGLGTLFLRPVINMSLNALPVPTRLYLASVRGEGGPEDPEFLKEFNKAMGWLREGL